MATTFVLADKEGLTAHRASVDMRLNRGMLIERSPHFPPHLAFSNTTILTSPMSLLPSRNSAMPGYEPGEQPQDGQFIKLNTNENPYASSPAVAGPLSAPFNGGCRSIPTRWRSVSRQAAEVLGVEPDWILCGNGSDDILTIVTRAFVGQGELPPLAVSQLHPVQSPGKLQGPRRGGLFSDATGRWATTSPRPATIATGVPGQPQQPLGHGGAAGAMLELAERLPCPLLVDEAYVDFAETNCVSLVKETTRSWLRGR